MALRGEAARAESAFAAVLSRSPGDPRALSGLGNIQFYRGKPEVALGYYDSALRAAHADAGIRLNRALALRQLGRSEQAAAERDSAVLLAGGPSAAGALLGLHIVEGSAPNRGYDLSAAIPVVRPATPGRPIRIGREDVRQFLLAAAWKVPADTSRVARETSARTVSRSAGSRSSDETELVMVLYWKH